MQRLKRATVATAAVAITLGCGETSNPGSSGSTGSGGSNSAASSGAMSTTGSGGASSSASGSGSGGAGTGGGMTGGGQSGPTWVDDGVQTTATKLDVLIIIDNSISMAHKQALFVESMDTLFERIANPLCVDDAGSPVAAQPPDATAACSEGAREFTPIADLHVGVITTSLGGHGGDVCGPTGSSFNPTQDDRAHLLPTVRAGLTSFEERGFLQYGTDSGGVVNVAQVLTDVASHVEAAGSEGCGYESSLEAAYRFLADPDPYESISVVNSQVQITGTDQELLDQRAAFLRPDSAVLVVMLTDENDCSLIDGGLGWAAATLALGSAPFRMPPATSSCAADPNDPCCRSCNVPEGTPPAGCQPLGEDPECAVTMLDQSEDSVNLRCFEQKRRFGLDLLYPVSRYVDGLSATQVTDRNGALVDSPLYAGGRHPSLVSFAVVGGVPWQDVAVDPSDTEALEYMSPEALADANRFAVIAGNPGEYVPPTDPFMQESIGPRSGTNPITGDPIVPETSMDPNESPINGHEKVNAGLNDLQYACTFALPDPVTCIAGEPCDCFIEEAAENRPVCNPPGGGAPADIQYGAGVYPSLRVLDLVRGLGRRGVVTSACTRNSTNTSRDDYAYRPNFRAVVRRLGQMLE